MFDLDAILSELGAVAHGVPLWTGPSSSPRTVDVATDEDWRECCLRAVVRVSKGAGRLESGWTWEEGIARWAAWYLRLGADEVAMGRTLDVTWSAQRERWVAIVFEVAALGSTHVRLELGTDGQPTEIPTGTVLTARGRVPLADVPRSTR
jgi:hypothetical protein